MAAFAVWSVLAPSQSKKEKVSSRNLPILVRETAMTGPNETHSEQDRVTGRGFRLQSRREL